jgi:1-phosphofructokinase family hexose kinase
VIVVSGLSPAWQQILSFAEFRMGEVNRATEAHWCASGKVLNVAIALAHLNRDADDISERDHVVSTLGGRAFEPVDEEFATLGIERTWIKTQAPTRVCTTILDQSSGTTTELVENAGAISSTEWGAFRATYARVAAQARVAVLTGSLPPGAPATAYRELLQQTPCPAVLDIRGPELLEALAARPLVVKPNLEELARTFPELVPAPSDAEAGDRGRIAAMQAMRERGAQWVVVTDGPRAVWIAGPGGVYRCQPPAVRLVNPIGSGDCFAAGMAWHLASSDDVLDGVKFGIAAAGENAQQLLPGRIDRRAVQAQCKKIDVRSIA